ncbi:MAG: hypothetical protein OMM_11845, partial [Candidatus Magnetoglobus multicellularis str. Araruama]
AGVGYNTSDATGFNMEGTDLAIALFAAKETETEMAGMQWTTVVAQSDVVEAVGLPSEMNLSVSELAVNLNRVDGTLASNATVIDYAHPDVEISIAVNKDERLVIDIPGIKGQLIQAYGQMDIVISEFFHLQGGMGFEVSAYDLQLDTNEVVSSNVFMFGSDDLFMFAGYNDPNEPGAIGVTLEHSNMALALIRSVDDDRSWISLKSHTQLASIIGVPGVSGVGVETGNFSVNANIGLMDQKGVSVPILIDNPLFVPTGVGFETLDYDREFIQIQGDMSLRIKDYVQLDGFFAFEAEPTVVPQRDGTPVEVNMFNVNAFGVNIFVGNNGPADNENAVGLTLENANVAMALMRAKDTQDDRSWFAIKADMVQGAFIGVEGLTASISDFAIEMNQTSDSDTDNVIDFSQHVIGIQVDDKTIELDFDSSDGALFKLEGYVDLNVFDFFQVQGRLAFGQENEIITLSDGSTIEADLFTMSAAEDLTAFAGVNGPSTEPDAIGFTLNEVNMALALMTSVNPDDKRTFVSLFANAGQAGFIGGESFNLTASDLTVMSNYVSEGDVVAHLADNPIVVHETAPTLDFHGDAGRFMIVDGHMDINVMDYFFAGGDMAVEFRTRDIDTQNIDGEGIIETMDLLTFGASDLMAFVGAGGPQDAEGAIGLSLSQVNMGLALMKSPSRSTQYLSLMASVGNASFIGIDDVTLSASDLSVELNQSINADDIAHLVENPIVVNTG